MPKKCTRLLSWTWRLVSGLLQPLSCLRPMPGSGKNLLRGQSPCWKPGHVSLARATSQGICHWHRTCRLAHKMQVGCESLASTEDRSSRPLGILFRPLGAGMGAGTHSPLPAAWRHGKRFSPAACLHVPVNFVCWPVQQPAYRSSWLSSVLKDLLGRTSCTANFLQPGMGTQPDLQGA